MVNYPDWLGYAKWSFEKVLEGEEAKGGSLRAEYAKRFLKWIDDGAKPEKLGLAPTKKEKKNVKKRKRK